jgi:hypothetical protein
MGVMNMKMNSFDMYNQLFTFYQEGVGLKQDFNNSLFRKIESESHRIWIDCVIIQDTDTEYIKRIIGFSTVKRGDKISFYKIEIPYAQYVSLDRWDILRKENQEVLYTTTLLWEDKYV